MADTSVSDIFSLARHVQRMLDVEGALARASARAGLIPPAAAEEIEARCRAELFDIPAIEADAVVAGTLTAPLVAGLTELVGGTAGGYVHWGATSQDVIDTALVLEARDAIDALDREMLAIGQLCCELSRRHRTTVMVGRTLLQQAVPITFGLKAARWLGLVTRQIERLRRVRSEALVLQFGGAAGTLAPFGDAGGQVAELLGEELGLRVPDMPWHAERDRVAELVLSVAVGATSMAKIAGDLVLLGQGEVGEVTSAPTPTEGRSSAMPQKRNAVHCVSALAASRLATGAATVVLSSPAHEHERAAGAWQAEWAAIPDVLRHTATATAAVRRALERVDVDADRMRSNLDAGRQLVMAEALATGLALRIGRASAQHVVADACDRVVRDGTTLAEEVGADQRITAVLSPEELRSALDPSAQLGTATSFVDRAIATFEALAR